MGSTEAERFETYYKAGLCWDKLRKRLTRSYGSFAYVQTLERHKKGGCHVNVDVGTPKLARAVETDWRAVRKEVIIPAATACGFGPVVWLERCDQASGRLAGYITKLAAELTGAEGKNQIPEDAPPHFRRLRASRGLLPPIPETDLTGQLVKVPIPCYTGQKSKVCGVDPVP